MGRHTGGGRLNVPNVQFVAQLIRFTAACPFRRPKPRSGYFAYLSSRHITVDETTWDRDTMRGYRMERSPSKASRAMPQMPRSALAIRIKSLPLLSFGLPSTVSKSNAIRFIMRG